MNSWCEQVHAIRAFTWNHRIANERNFLQQWLARIRSAFRVDFSFAAVLLNARKIETVAPENSSALRSIVEFVSSFLEDLSASKVPTVVEDVRRRWGFTSLVVASLAPAARQPLGVVAVGASGMRTFTAPESFQLQYLTEEAGRALKRLAARRVRDEQEILRAVIEDMNVLELEPLLARITDRVRNYLASEICTIRLYVAQGRLCPVAMAPAQNSDVSRFLPAHHRELTPLLLRRRRSIVIPGLCKEPSSSSRVVQINPKAYLGTRLLSRENKLIGVLEICSAAPRIFGREEVAFLEAVAQLASMAIVHHGLLQNSKT